MLGVDPEVKLRLKLPECRYVGLLLLDDSDLLLDQLKPVGSRVIESPALVLETGRFDVCLCPKIEVEVVVGTPGTLEDTHGSARGGTSVVRNKLALGAEHDVAVLFTFAALNVHDHASAIDVADLQARSSVRRTPVP